MGVYLTELLEELVSDVPLNRRARTGILDTGVCRAEGDWYSSSPPNVRSCWGVLKVVAGRRIASTPVASSCASSSNVGMPKPGEVTSCPPTTSPKNGCRPPAAGFFTGVVIVFREGDICCSTLLLLPVVRRVAGGFRGIAGAGCGLSRGFRLLNL